MNKIEEILQTYTGCKGTCECGCGLVEAMEEFGKICFNAATEVDTSQGYFGGPKYENYEDFLKEIEDEE